MRENPNIVIFGVGAIGGSVGGWIAARYEPVYFLARGETAEALRSNGLTLYQGGDKNQEPFAVKVIQDLDEVPEVDVIVLAVKNYSLNSAAKAIKDKVGDKPVILAMQNGVENQKILPRYFSKVIYCIVAYNAWRDGPAKIGYQKKGPLILGTIEDQLQSEMNEVARIFNKSVETTITPHLQDAAISKMIINLSNSLTTLVGHPYQEISSMSIFQKLLANLTYEGIQIAKAAGYQECKLGDLPSWSLLTAAAKLPQFLTRRAFDKNVEKLVISSMAQDILQRKGTDSELESLNGYFIKLANEHHLKVSYNQTIYDLCKEKFAKPGFAPMDVKEVWEKVKAKV
jgi:2-dehydropantoate 2-reductase